MAQSIQNAETLAAETATESSDGGIAASLGLNTQLFVFQLINFAVVAFIVWRFILKPLVKKMDERQKMIDESIDNAKRVETNLAMSEQKYQERIDEAKVEANKVIGRSQEEAEELAEKLKGKAKQDVDELIKQAKGKIQDEKKAMSDELRKETGALVIAAVEKVIREKLDEKKDRKLIEDSLKSIQ